MRVTRSENEDGASSWSPAGYVAFESHPSDDAPSAIYRIRVDPEDVAHELRTLAKATAASPVDPKHWRDTAALALLGYV